MIGVNKTWRLKNQLIWQYGSLLTICTILLEICFIFTNRMAPILAGQSDFRYSDNFSQLNMEELLEGKMSFIENKIQLVKNTFQSFNSVVYTLNQPESQLQFIDNYKYTNEILYYNEPIPNAIAESQLNNSLYYGTKISWKALSYMDNQGLGRLSTEQKGWLGIFLDYFLKDPLRKILIVSGVNVYFSTGKVFARMPAGSIKLEDSRKQQRFEELPCILEVNRRISEGQQKTEFSERSNEVFLTHLYKGIGNHVDNVISFCSWTYIQMTPTRPKELVILSLDAIFHNIFNEIRFRKGHNFINVAFVDQETDILLNDCFQQKGKLMHFYDTEITGFTREQYQRIIRSKVALIEKKQNGYKYQLTCFNKVIENRKVYVIMFSEYTDVMKQADSIITKENKLMKAWWMSLEVALIFNWLIGLLFIAWYAKRIAQPLSKFSQFASEYSHAQCTSNKIIFQRSLAEYSQNTRGINDKNVDDLVEVFTDFASHLEKLGQNMIEEEAKQISQNNYCANNYTSKDFRQERTFITSMMRDYAKDDSDLINESTTFDSEKTNRTLRRDVSNVNRNREMDSQISADNTSRSNRLFYEHKHKQIQENDNHDSQSQPCPQQVATSRYPRWLYDVLRQINPKINSMTEADIRHKTLKHFLPKKKDI